MTTRTDVVIDCDPGIDDALALLLAVASPELQVLGVTCVAGNRPVEITTDNACRLLHVAGYASIPVYAGCARPLAYPQARCNLVHGADGLGGAALADGRRPEPMHAVDFLIDALLNRPADTLTVITLGPLTNAALAEIKSPGILCRAKQVLVMGGAAFCPGNITPSAEFNFYADALAAHVVLSSGAKLTLFGLDVTGKAVMPAPWIQSFAALPTRTGAAVHHMLGAYAAVDPLLHDACPVAYAIDPALFAGGVYSAVVGWDKGINEGHLWVQDATRVHKTFGTATKLMTQVISERLLALVHDRIARLP